MPRPTSPLTVGAVDIGFGQTKFTRSRLRPTGPTTTSRFPSFAAWARNADVECGAGLQQLDVVPTRVGAATFRVGPDAVRAGSANVIRTTGTDFYKSDDYVALLRGALSYMDPPPEQDRLDMLGVGLPVLADVFQHRRLRSDVIERVRGVHEVPDLRDRGRTRSIHIADVCMVGQGIGALIAQAITDERFSQPDHRSLLIDCGFGTLLWVVSSGLRPEHDRCGGTMAGAFSVLNAVAHHISPSLAGDPRMLSRIDDALRLNKRLLVEGQLVDLHPHRAVAEVQATTNLRAVINGVGRTVDIDSIVLCGGAAHLFLGALQTLLPDRGVVLVADAHLANLTGYLIRAEHLARSVSA